jgi:hypothetical protein
MADTGDKVIRVYSDFRGIDLRGEECALNRSPDALNVWRDYRELSGIKTRPALKKLYKSDIAITGMRVNDNSVFFVDNMLQKLTINADGTLGNGDSKVTFIGDNAFFFDFNGKPYAIGESNFIDAETGDDVVPFVPTTSTGASPSGAGRKTYQDVNMLTPYRINTFRGDGGKDGSNVLVLDAQNIDNETPEVEIFDDNKWKTVKEYFQLDGSGIGFDPANGTVTVSVDGWLPEPLTNGQDNIRVKFKKTVEGYSDKILGCTIAQEFDNRVFFSGNSKYPNLVFHSSLNDVTYFSDLDVYEDGKDDGKIRAMVAGNNALWVFRDTEKGNGVYYHTAAFDETYGKVYPSAHSSVSIGCVGGAVNFLDDILFFSREGLEGITQNVTAEQFATHKSSLVDREMLKNKDYKDLVLAEWEGYLIVFIGSEAYLADSRAVLANEGHYEYEWYRWQLFKDNRDSVTCATVHNGELYIGTKEGYIFKLDKDTKNGDEYYYEDKNYSPIESYWTTPKDKFASSNKQKTTNKKGCIVEATGDLTVSAKVDNNDNGFEEVESYTDIKDHIVPKIKCKKFKDIQLKFKSNTKFTLESVTLEAFVGSFIKR